MTLYFFLAEAFPVDINELPGRHKQMTWIVVNRSVPNSKGRRGHTSRPVAVTRPELQSWRSPLTSTSASRSIPGLRSRLPMEITLSMMRESLTAAVVADALDSLGYRNPVTACGLAATDQ